MSTDRDALLRVVLANPADDTVRLVFADWLRENGEGERAALIQLQIERGSQASAEWPRDGGVIPYDDWPDSAASIFHEDLRSIERSHGFEFRWHRGWIDQVSLPMLTFLDRAETLFRAHPVEFITLSDVRPEVAPSAAATVDPTNPADTALLPHVLNREDGEGTLFGSLLPEPLWELLMGYTGIYNEPIILNKTFPSFAHAIESLSRACVMYGRMLALLPRWNPPYRLISGVGKKAKRPPL